MIRPKRSVLVALGILSVLPALAQIAGTAQVLQLTGTLTVKRAREQSHALRVNDSVMSGDELITGENSYATIRTATGAAVQVFPDSRVIFNERSADIQEFLHLFFGSIKVHVEKLTGRPNPHKLTTPTAVIAVRGTTFSVFVDENDSTLVAVDEGTVSVANIRMPGQEVILEGGQRTWVHAGQPPTQAQRFRGRSERADLTPARARPQRMAGREDAQQSGMSERMEPMPGPGAMGGMMAHPGRHD